MPTKGYKTITITTKTYNQLQHIAKKDHRSIPKQIQHLIETTQQNNNTEE